MAEIKRRRGFAGGLLVVTLGTLTLYCVSFVQGPNRDLSFVREVRSEQTPLALGQALDHVPEWPEWYYNAQAVQLLDAKDLETGKIVRFYFEPQKKQWKRFQLEARVVAFEPGKKVELQLLTDSTGKIAKVFENLKWSVELIPEQRSGHSPGTLIRGTLRARTVSWRSRLFAGLAQRIMLNQVFFPDLQKLAAFMPTSSHLLHSPQLETPW